MSGSGGGRSGVKKTDWFYSPGHKINDGMKLDDIPEDPEMAIYYFKQKEAERRKRLTPEQRAELEEMMKNLHTQENHEKLKKEFQCEYDCEYIDSEEDSDETL